MIDSAWVALSLTERIGGKTLRALMAHFNHDTRAVLAADVEMLRQVPGIGPKLAERIRSINLSQVEQAIPRWQDKGVQIITENDPAYPNQLRASAEDAPPTLFVRGHWRPYANKRVAIVGTREPSDEARNIATNLGMTLSERGYSVVSGLAVGIDTVAHWGALSFSGSSLAVLGSGVLNIYPPSNQKLANAIMRSGALVSEVHPNASPNASNLVARNRIITGLSDAVIVVETSVDGGAMHAARFALAQGRPLYTFDSPASGNRALLANGAAALHPDLRDLPF